MAKRTASRRGSIYLMVLGSGMIVAVIGIAGVMLGRIEHKAATRADSVAAASLAAQSAVELALERVRTQPSWWQTTGPWADAQPIGEGEMSITVVPVGNAMVGPGGAFAIRGTGRHGEAVQLWEARIAYDSAASAGMAQAIMVDGPLAYWPLGDLEGTVARDVIGGHDGEYRGGTSLAAASRVAGDAAPMLDGVDDFVLIEHDPRFILAQGSVEFWFRAVATHDQGLVSKDADHDGEGQLTLAIEHRRVTVHLEHASGDVKVESPEVAAAAWQHVVFTFGPAGMHLYVNGAQVAEDLYSGGLGSSSGGPGNTEELAFGVAGDRSANGSIAGWRRPFGGSIDDVAIYPRQLSASRVAAHYAARTTVPRWGLVDGGWRRVVN